MAGKDKHWADMTKAEQAAVETLGWTNEARTQGILAPLPSTKNCPAPPHRRHSGPRAAPAGWGRGPAEA